MAEKDEIQGMLAELKAMQEAMKQGVTQAQPQAQQQGGIFSGWQKPTPNLGAMQVEKVLVPVELGTREGRVTVYFQLSGQIAGDPETLLSTVEGMQSAGIPVKAWQQKSSGWKR
jgi:hypothetical protein